MTTWNQQAEPSSSYSAPPAPATDYDRIYVPDGSLETGEGWISGNGGTRLEYPGLAYDGDWLGSCPQLSGFLSPGYFQREIEAKTGAAAAITLYQWPFFVAGDETLLFEVRQGGGDWMTLSELGLSGLPYDWSLWTIPPFDINELPVEIKIAGKTPWAVNHYWLFDLVVAEEVPLVSSWTEPTDPVTPWS